MYIVHVKPWLILVSVFIVHINCYILYILMDNLSLYIVLKHGQMVQGTFSKQYKYMYGHSKFWQTTLKSPHTKNVYVM